MNEDKSEGRPLLTQAWMWSKARLHMVLPLLSHMVFGLLPPVLCGLSFRESNDGENKMMRCFARLHCAACARDVHVYRRAMTYFKTLIYYLTIAVSLSGILYNASVLITRLLKHFGTIDLGGALAPHASPGLLFSHLGGAHTSA